MRVGDAFPGEYLKCADLKGQRVLVHVSGVTIEDVSGDKKPLVRFVGKERGLVLNKTNANHMAEIFGTDEMDRWAGRAIVLVPAKTEFQGKRVDCIRVDQAPPGTVAPARPEPEPPVITDDDVPF